MKTLIIANYPEEQYQFRFKKHFADELKRDDVIFIENPKNKADLEEKLEFYQGQFDRVMISAHGDKGDIPTMGIVGESFLTITDVIKDINKGNEETLKKIHLTSCFIGSNFEKIEQKDASTQYYSELERSLLGDQTLFLHGDTYTGDIKYSIDQRLKGIVENKEYSVSEAVLDSVEAMSIVTKRHHNLRGDYFLETFSYQPFGREDEEFSTAILRLYLNDVIKRARSFEKAQGILNGDASEMGLKDLSEENLRRYLSARFLREISKSVDANHSKMVESLFKTVDPNLADTDGRTALMISSDKGHAEIAKLLLANEKTNPDLADTDGWTALMYAADSGNVEIVEYLIEKGADPEIKTPQGNAASYFAKGENKDEIIELLSQAIEKKHQDAILKEWESAFSSEELKQMQEESSNSIPDFLGQEIAEGNFEMGSEISWDGNKQVSDSKESGQGFNSPNPRLRGGKIGAPSTTIEDGAKVLLGAAGLAATKFLAKKLAAQKPKPTERTQ